MTITPRRPRGVRFTQKESLVMSIGKVLVHRRSKEKGRDG